MRVPTRRGEQLAQTKKSNDAFLTPAAIQRMRDEIVRLEKEERPPAAEELRRTAAMGDLSENAAYSYAKAQLRRINNRIDSLKLRVANAIPIETGTGDDGRARIGSTVVVASGGRQMTFEIVGSQETNPLRGRISYLSPIGAALMGKTAGETAVVPVGGNEVAYVINEVR